MLEGIPEVEVMTVIIKMEKVDDAIRVEINRIISTKSERERKVAGVKILYCKC